MTGVFNQPVICPTLIGRTDEIAVFHKLIDEVKSGKGQVILLCGEAGIGKSRLIAELKTEAFAQGFQSLQGSCFPTDHSCPYAPLLDMLHSVFLHTNTAQLGSSLEPFARELKPLLPEVSQLFPEGATLPPLLSLDPEQEKRRLFAALAHFFLSQAAQHPLLLIVEDVHWSDETSLEFLQYLARRCTTQPLLVLLTYRSDGTHPSLDHWLAQLDRARLSQEVMLTCLTRSETDAMLRAIFDVQRPVPAEMLDAIYTLTEGNPFFIEEILKSLIAAGEIFHTHGAWDRKRLRELHIPRTLQDAVKERSDHVSADARQVLILAAVAGRRFDFAVLQHVTNHDEQQLLTVMKELMAAQLVVEESAEQFAFRHALTRQAIYAALLVRERKAWHRTIAETMERLYRTTLDTHLADLAHHFYEAGRWEKVLEYAQRAGEQAQKLYAWPAAIEHYTRALDSARHLALSPPPRLYRARGQAYEALGEFDAARHDYEQVQEAAHQGHDGANEWQSLIDLGSLWTRRDFKRAGEWFQHAIELTQTLADAKLHAHTLNHMGKRYVYIAQPLEALRCHQEALALFQTLNEQRGIAETLDSLGFLSYLSGDLIQGNAYYEQAIALFHELDDRQRLASSPVILMLCKGTSYQNDLLVPAAASLAESLCYGESALQIAREIEQRSLEAYALIYMGCCLGPHGEYARALESLQAGLTILEELDHPQWMIDANWILGALYLDLLAPSLAQRNLERALALAHETSSPGWVRMVTGLLASVCVQQQDLAKAESVLGPLLSPQTRRMGQRMAWCARAELALAQRDPNLALHIVEQLIASAANSSSQSAIPRLSHLRGNALTMLKKLAEAETALRDAHTAAMTQGLRPLLWRVAIDLGKLYQTQHRVEEAEQAFATAQEVVKELTTSIQDRSLREHFQQQAAALMPAPPSLSPRRLAKRAFGRLTEREREVATLIAQGKSNGEIAERLTITERTVETHVRNILTKLDLTSRTQIAVWTITVGLTNNVL